MSKSLIPRYGHGSVISGKNLLLIGGYLSEIGPSSQVLHVDLSKPFPTQAPPYVQKSHSMDLSFNYSVCRIMHQGPIIRCIGGYSSRQTQPGGNRSVIDLLFHYPSSRWAGLSTLSPPHSPLPNPRIWHGVVFADDSLYLFGGSLGTVDDASPFQPPENLSNELWKLDIASNRWTRIITQGPTPPNMAQMTFTSINSSPHLLVCIGGIGNDGNLLPLDTIWVYNTLTSTWQTYTVKGDRLPPLRRAHASCSIGNFVYTFGGTNLDGSFIYADMYALSLDDDTYTWHLISKPTLKEYQDGGGKYPIGRAFHQLSCTNNRIFVTFGYSGQLAKDDLLLQMTVFSNGNGLNPYRPVPLMHLYDLDLGNVGDWTTQYNPPSNEDMVGEFVPNAQLPESISQLFTGQATHMGSTFWNMPVSVGIGCGVMALVVAIVIYYIRSHLRRKSDRQLASMTKPPIALPLTLGSYSLPPHKSVHSTDIEDETTLPTDNRILESHDARSMSLSQFDFLYMSPIHMTSSARISSLPRPATSSVNLTINTPMHTSPKSCVPMHKQVREMRPVLVTQSDSNVLQASTAGLVHSDLGDRVVGSCPDSFNDSDIASFGNWDQVHSME